ncbi:MAG TPA: hypothetical protein VEP89_02080 [Draconibacterium sp.]|nr:hypothetical protein [Draconibacterium sp.]
MGEQYKSINEELIYKNLEIEYAEAQKSEIFQSAFSYYYILERSLFNIAVNKVELNEISTRDNSRLKEIIDEKKIIFRFFASNCSSCIETELASLKTLTKKIGKRRVILLTNKSTSQICNFMITNKIEIDLYETENLDLGIDFDKKNIPYLFFCDSNLNISSPFVLDNHSKDFVEHYYQSLLERFDD